MDARTCKTANGEPGVTVNGKDCHNPCLPGMAPISNWQCASKCVADGDCTKDGRAGSCKDGLCERPIELACQGGGKPSKCKTDEGDDGQRCKTSDECLQTNLICPSGLVMYGGTHCAKQCKTASDCPKGECSEEICGPLCPSEGCPYLWE